MLRHVSAWTTRRERSVETMMAIHARIPLYRNRSDIDERAREIVLAAYRESNHAGRQTAFDAALRSYMKRYSHINRELAGHAVAYILATAEI
jgi:hypothetical protein